MASLGNRIVVLIDMDCFFCQVETRLRPEYAGKPLAVVQYNLWRTGGIIAVNYEAREFGVTRHMRGEEAKEKCPEIILATVPPLRGKADTSRYRSAGREVIDVLKKHCNIVERASVDEAYLDITQIVDDKLAKEELEFNDMAKELNSTFIVGHSEVGVNDEEQRKEGLKSWLSESSKDTQIQRLAVAGLIVENIRKDVFETTGFNCSAGISFNKILAKLACGLHKPKRQTILPVSAVPELFGTLPVKKVRHLGGKLGDIVIDSLKCNVMADLLPYSLQHLQNRFDDKTGNWLYNIARGIDNEPVTPRLVSKSIGACKRFPGKQAIVDAEVLKHWLAELSAEVCERLEQDLEENERRASLLTISFQFCQNKNSVSQSRSIALTTYKPEKMMEQCLNVVVKATQQHPISFLGLSAAKFIKAKGSEHFMNFFKTGASSKPICTVQNDDTDDTTEDVKLEEEMEKCDVNVNNVKVSNAEVNNTEENNDEENNAEENNAICFEERPGHKSVKSISSKKKVNRKSSPCTSIQKSLKSDNFKKSFFMNILKEKQPRVEETIIVESETLQTDHQNIDNVEKLSNDDETVTENITVSKQTVSSDKQSEYQNCLPDNGEAVVALQEIFPDLNDIDPDIVRMLPLHLQQEAKKLLKMSKEKDKSAEISKVKNKEANKVSKERTSKSKSSYQKPKNIQNFFIKTDASNDLNNNYKKCAECDQLILISKFDEHSDYHMAKNLQKEINRVPNVDENRKRKGSLESPNHSKKRLSGEVVINT